MGREATLSLTKQGVRVTGIDGWSWDAPFSFTRKRFAETGAGNVCGIFSQRDVPERGMELIPAYLGAAGMGKLAARLREAEPDPSSFCVTAATLGDSGVAPADRVRIW